LTPRGSLMGSNYRMTHCPYCDPASTPIRLRDVVLNRLKENIDPFDRLLSVCGRK